jgi:hypothetical protein
MLRFLAAGENQMNSISRTIALSGVVALIAAATPATAATFMWTQGGDFDILSQSIDPTLANQISFASSVSPYAHSHGQDVNFTITATIDGVDKVIYTQLLTNGSEQSILALGPINFVGGTVSSIGFGCDACSGNTFHYFGYSGETTFSLATAGVPEPANWALLIAGFGLVGAAARRRRAVAVSA